MPSDGGTTTARYVPRAADDPTYDVDPGHGWVLFAGIMFVVIGLLNVIYGIAAISDSKFYVRDVEYVIGTLHTWGWALTIVGLVQLAVAVGIWRNSDAARWAGVALASLNMIIQVFVLPAYPAWAIMVFFIDVIVIFGLVRYGGRDRWSLS
jgi:hypothetical protein